MIIKKPYAFLIKRFKIIHLILFFLASFIAYQSFEIYSFFNSFASSNYASNVSISIKSISYIILILLILLSAVIYVLLKDKKKPNNFYMFNILYYALLFIFILYFSNQISNIDNNIPSFEKIRLLRDVSSIIFVSNFYSIIIFLVRGLGFNIKSFNFDKDIMGLNIEEKDAEEIEISLSSNYKYKKNIIKLFRHIKYFILENKLFVTIISSVVALSLSILMVSKLKEYTIYYDEMQQIASNYAEYTVLKSYLTDNDIYGNEINSDKIYLLILVNFRNKTQNNIYVDRDSFRIKLNNQYYFPIQSNQEYFMDIGKIFTPFNLESGFDDDLLLVFELNKKDIKKEYDLKIKNEVLSSDDKFIDIVITPTTLEYDTTSNQNIPGLIDFSKTIIGSSKLEINSYEIKKYFNEKYEICDKKCEEYTYIVKPENASNYVLKIDSNLVINSDNYIYNVIQNEYNIYKYFASIDYRSYGNRNINRASVINNQNISTNITYIEVPSDIKDADKISIIIDIRGIKYNLILK